MFQWFLLPMRHCNETGENQLDLEGVPEPAVPSEGLADRQTCVGGPCRSRPNTCAHALAPFVLAWVRHGAKRWPVCAAELRTWSGVPAYRRYLPVREWFGLQNMARWTKTGVQYRELEHKIYPRPGCYFAVPNSKWVCFHFQVFDEWVAKRALCNARAILDVGTGCGVLSFVMRKHAEALGLDDVHIRAVDINPNAIATVNATA